MRLLLDANLGSTIARALARAGHEVERTIASAPDHQVLASAVEQDRVLLTCDRDFGDLIFFQRQPAPRAVVYIRFEPEDVREIVPRLLAVLEPAVIDHHMTVIDDAQVRRRPLPHWERDNG